MDLLHPPTTTTKASPEVQLAKAGAEKGMAGVSDPAVLDAYKECCRTDCEEARILSKEMGKASVKVCERTCVISPLYICVGVGGWVYLCSSCVRRRS